jgi:hypothetical protein
MWLFYGRHAPVRPQDPLPLAPHASSAESMLEGDRIWLLDESRGIRDDLAIGPATTAITIQASCDSLLPDA